MENAFGVAYTKVVDELTRLHMRVLNISYEEAHADTIVYVQDWRKYWESLTDEQRAAKRRRARAEHGGLS